MPHNQTRSPRGAEPPAAHERRTPTRDRQTQRQAAPTTTAADTPRKKDHGRPPLRQLGRRRIARRRPADLTRRASVHSIHLDLVPRTDIDSNEIVAP